MMMDLTNINNLIGYSDPIEMPVSELLTGSFKFSIPSYQRGYRWESSEEGVTDNDVKQVDDLLNDLTSFAKAKDSRNYYLQPLMVKPRKTSSNGYEWDVLDGQQRLTTMLLLLSCINEKLYANSPLPLYTIRYENREQLDFSKIKFNPLSPDYNYPSLSSNLDSYFIRKAKDRIERWFDQELDNNQALQDRMKELLFYPDLTRGTSSEPSLRAIFIWYNVEPIANFDEPISENRMHDIEVFNRLNRGKISLTDSELIKALFLLCIKNSPASSSSLMTSDTLVRKWDEMGKQFQNEEFWKMISPKDKEYSNRMDLLFDFIKDCKVGTSITAYRYYYAEMRDLLTKPDTQRVELLWNEIKQFFDILCKWHEDFHLHNFIGYLVECGSNISTIYKSFNKGQELKSLVKNSLGFSDINDIDELSYNESYAKIRKTLFLFNILTCDKFGLKFPFDLYRDNAYDVEHVNPQTDNPIEKIEEKKEWIIEHALACLWVDRKERTNNGCFTQAAIEARNLIIEGILLLKEFKKNNDKDVGNKFKPYRVKVENFYASGNSTTSMENKDSIGNLTLLNASINREYKNALFPKKLRTLKRSDQEGAYIPLCTKYMFLKYYSNPQENVSAFSMMRWRTADQEEYMNAIKESIKTIL